VDLSGHFSLSLSLSLSVSVSLSLSLSKEGFSLGKLRKHYEPITAVRQAI
jgi:hypothetical protein